MTKRNVRAEIADVCRERIMFLDGAMGTMIQLVKPPLEEADFRGEQFKDWDRSLKGNNDILCLTRPDIILDIHMQYLSAGSDIVSTNTFSGTSIAQADYGMEAHVYDLNLAAAKLVRKAVDDTMAAEPGRKCWAMGALGPTNRTASISPSVAFAPSA